MKDQITLKWHEKDQPALFSGLEFLVWPLMVLIVAKFVQVIAGTPVISIIDFAGGLVLATAMYLCIERSWQHYVRKKNNEVNNGGQ